MNAMMRLITCSSTAPFFPSSILHIFLVSRSFTTKMGVGLLVNLAHEAIVHMQLWVIALLVPRFVVRLSLSAPADAVGAP